MEPMYRRELPVKGAYNIRDLGGYETKDGKKVKWKKVIRAGELSELTPEDLIYLKELGIKTCIDFRSQQERSEAPDKTIPELKEEVWLPINAGDMSAVPLINPNNLVVLMEEAYQYIIRHSQNTYKEFFRLLAEEEKTPLLFHCTAGKDRTGIGAALFLSSLGVDRKIIMEDYLLSAEYLKGKYDSLIEKYPAFAPLATVKPEYLQAAFRMLDSEFGGTDNYLTRYLGVNLEKMKKIYTE